MISDGGWAFCEIGQFARALHHHSQCRLLHHAAHAAPQCALGDTKPEIRLSAFLRLLNSRDVYRRVYQLRIEAEPMLDLLWKNQVAPAPSRAASRPAPRVCWMPATKIHPPPSARSQGIEALVQQIRIDGLGALAG